MDQQKVFTTAFMGFEKKAVLDYIYEQDMLFKKKEADWEKQLADCEQRLEAAEQNHSAAEEYQEQIDGLAAGLNEEKENSALVQARYDKLSEEIDQLVQSAKNKERELQLQLEVNNQLKFKCDQLEAKLRVLADHMIAEREHAAEAPEPPKVSEPSGAPELPAPIAYAAEVIKAPAQEPQTEPKLPEIQVEVVDLKEELEEFRSSVSKTLLNFEAALARLDSGKPESEAEAENQAFFR